MSDPPAPGNEPATPWGRYLHRRARVFERLRPGARPRDWLVAVAWGALELGAVGAVLGLALEGFPGLAQRPDVALHNAGKLGGLLALVGAALPVLLHLLLRLLPSGPDEIARERDRAARRALGSGPVHPHLRLGLTVTAQGWAPPYDVGVLRLTAGALSFDSTHSGFELPLNELARVEPAGVVPCGFRIWLRDGSRQLVWVGPWAFTPWNDALARARDACPPSVGPPASVTRRRDPPRIPPSELVFLVRLFAGLQCALLLLVLALAAFPDVNLMLLGIAALQPLGVLVIAGRSPQVARRSRILAASNLASLVGGGLVPTWAVLEGLVPWHWTLGVYAVLALMALLGALRAQAWLGAPDPPANSNEG